MTTSQISQDDTIKAVLQACDTFCGVMPPSVYKDFVLAMLFYKYISDECSKFVTQCCHDSGLAHDEILSQQLVLPEGTSFWDLYELRDHPGNGERIDNALKSIEDANSHTLKDVFQFIKFNTDRLGQEKQRDELLCRLLEVFGKVSLNLSSERVGNLEAIGNAYECLIKYFASNSGAIVAEYYTPPEVSTLLATALEPKENDRICDPCAGSGSLLLRSGVIARKNFDSKEYELFGQEVIGSTWALAKMNMLLHGVKNHRIEWGDTLKEPLLLESGRKGLLCFDVVISRPPFSLDNWGYENARNDPYDRYGRGIPPKTKADYAFICHMIETLHPETGRLGVILPHGVLFRASSEGKIRQQLIEENLLDAVIGLPEKLFFSTCIPTVILIFKKRKDDSSVLFIDASREFLHGKKQNQLTPANIQKILDTYKARVNVDKYAHLATFDEIKENDFNLNIPRYIDTFEGETEIDLNVVFNKRERLKTELQELELEMDGYLKALGYGIDSQDFSS